MLQEIIDKLAQPGKNLYAKFQGLLYDATIGLIRDYQKKTLELVKIATATCYLQTLQSLRRVAVIFFLVTLASIVFAMALVIVPIALVLISPWTVTQKMIAILCFGLLDAGAALAYLANLFSENNWMKVTKSQEIVDKIMNTSL